MIPAIVAILANFGLVLGVLIGDARLIIAACSAMAAALLWVLGVMAADRIRHRLADAELLKLKAREHELRVMRTHKRWEMFT